MSGHSKWANIKHKKGKTDALKAKLATKIGREITVAARMGGADPTGNMRLKLALQKARENNIPKDNIQRAIDKGIGATDMNAYEEIVYEGYGPAGVAVTVEVMTDNRNRAAADVRHAFSKQGGNLGESGCVGWMFKSKGVFVIDKEGHDEDEVTMLALEAGAEDLKSEDDVLTGAQWGTLMHEAMQWLPLVKYTQASLTKELDALVAKGTFTEEERNLLSDTSLYKFFNSDLGKRLINAKRIERELPFSMLFEGKRVYDTLEDGENLFLQGIIDTAFEEDGEWVLVDYKTDRVTSGEELIKRYKIQMDLYKEALQRLTGMPVKACYIYSFRLHDAIIVD